MQWKVSVNNIQGYAIIVPFSFFSDLQYLVPRQVLLPFHMFTDSFDLTEPNKVPPSMDLWMNFSSSLLTNLGQRWDKDPEGDDEGDLDTLEVDVENLVLMLRVPLMRRLVVTQPSVAHMVLGGGGKWLIASDVYVCQIN